MSLLAAAAFVLPLLPQPEPYTMPAPRHEGAVMAQSRSAALSEIPLSIWHAESEKATHLQTRLTCAKSIAEFDRDKLVVFDGFGFDVACNYARSAGGDITLYLTRRQGRQLADDLASAQDAIKKRYPGIMPVLDTTAAPTGLAFQGALYVLPDGTRSGVWVADVSGWTFKFRATYKPDQEAAVMKALTSIAQAANGSAGTHLAACAAAPAVTRDGKQITDQDRLSALSLMAGILEASAKEKAEAEVNFAEQWCAEEGTGDNETPMLFWRNIALTGNAGPMDRMTLMTMGKAPAIVSFANPMASLIEKEATGKDALIYQLTEKRGTTSYVFAFFNGRPGTPALTPLSKEIFLGRQNPLTSYDPTSNTINIGLPPSKPGS